MKMEKNFHLPACVWLLFPTNGDWMNCSDERRVINYSVILIVINTLVLLFLFTILLSQAWELITVFCILLWLNVIYNIFYPGTASSLRRTQKFGNATDDSTYGSHDCRVSGTSYFIIAIGTQQLLRTWLFLVVTNLILHLVDHACQRLIIWLHHSFNDKIQILIMWSSELNFFPKRSHVHTAHIPHFQSHFFLHSFNNDYGAMMMVMMKFSNLLIAGSHYLTLF